MAGDRNRRTTVGVQEEQSDLQLSYYGCLLLSQYNKAEFSPFCASTMELLLFPACGGGNVVFQPWFAFFLFCGFRVLKLTKRSNVSSVMVRSSCFHVISQPIKQCQAWRCYWRKHFYCQDFSGWGTRADCYHRSQQQQKPPRSYLDQNWQSFTSKWICAHLWFAWDFITACKSWFSASVQGIQTQTHFSFCLLHLSGANIGTNNSLPVLSLPGQQLMLLVLFFFFFLKQTGFGFHYSKGWLIWHPLLFTSQGDDTSNNSHSEGHQRRTMSKPAAWDKISDLSYSLVTHGSSSMNLRYTM